jgi:prevent-host-death family protein
MVTVPLSEAKVQLSALVDDVVRTHERVMVTRKGRPAVVILSVDDLASIEETLEIMSEPGAVQQIKDSAAMAERGEYVTLAQLRADIEARDR